MASDTIFHWYFAPNQNMLILPGEGTHGTVKKWYNLPSHARVKKPLCIKLKLQMINFPYHDKTIEERFHCNNIDAISELISM